MIKFQTMLVVLLLQLLGACCVADMLFISNSQKNNAYKPQIKFKHGGKVKKYELEYKFGDKKRNNWELCSAPDHVFISITNPDDIKVDFTYGHNPFDFNYSFDQKNTGIFVVQWFIQLIVASSDLKFADNTVQIELGDGDVYDMDIFSGAELNITYGENENIIIDLEKQSEEKLLFEEIFEFIKKGSNLNANDMVFLDLDNIPNSGKAWGRKQRLWMFKSDGNIFLGLMDLEGKKSFPPGELRPYFIPRVSIYTTRNSVIKNLPPVFAEYLQEKDGTEISLEEINKYKNISKTINTWSVGFHHREDSYTITAEDDPGSYMWLHEEVNNRKFKFKMDTNKNENEEFPFRTIKIARLPDEKHTYEIHVALNKNDLNETDLQGMSDFLVLCFWGLGVFENADANNESFSLRENAVVFETNEINVEVFMVDPDGKVPSKYENSLGAAIGKNVKWDRVFSTDSAYTYDYQSSRTAGGADFRVKRSGNYKFSKLKVKEMFSQPEHVSVIYSRKDLSSDWSMKAEFSRITPNPDDWDYALNYLYLYPKVKFLSENSYSRTKKENPPEILMSKELELRLGEEDTVKVRGKASAVVDARNVWAIEEGKISGNLPEWEELKNYDKNIRKLVEKPFLIEIILTPLGEPLRLEIFKQ